MLALFPAKIPEWEKANELLEKGLEICNELPVLSGGGGGGWEVYPCISYDSHSYRVLQNLCNRA